MTRLSLAATSWADAAPPLLVLLSGVTHKDWTNLEEWPPPANSGAVTRSYRWTYWLVKYCTLILVFPTYLKTKLALVAWMCLE